MSVSMKTPFAPVGSTALLPGGTSGLGHAIAEMFLQNGIDVAVCSRHPESAPDLAELAAAGTIKALCKSGTTAGLYYPILLENRDAVQQAMARQNS